MADHTPGQTAYYVVVLERELPVADYHQDYAGQDGHDGTDEAAIKQVVEELQVAYDEGAGGFFKVAGRIIKKGSTLNTEASVYAAAPDLLAALERHAYDNVGSALDFLGRGDTEGVRMVLEAMRAESNTAIAAAKKEAQDTCQRCDSTLQSGHCTDVACPFSDCDQSDPRGWAGHPDYREAV